LASVGEDGFVKFWKSADLGRISFEQSPTTQIWRLAYNPVKKIVATADNDGAIRFYRSEAPRLQTHGNHANDVISLGFRNDDVLSLDLDGAVTTFHPVSGQEEQSKLPVQFQSGIRLARYQPNLNRFVIGYGRSAAGSGQLVTWDPRDPTKVQQTNLPQPIVSLDCHPTEPMLGFVTGQAILGLRRLPDLANLPSQPDFPIQRDSEMRSPGRVAWSRAVGVLTVVLSHAKKDLSEVARFAYDGRKLTELEPLKVPARISTISWHPKEDVVAIGTTAGSVFLGSVKGGLTEFLPGHDGAVRTLTWSADGQRLFSGGDDRSAKVWEYKPTNKFKLTLLTTLLPPNGAILAIATAPDRKGVYLAGTDPKISYWSQDHYFADAILTRAQQRVNRNMFRAEWLRYTESDPARQAKYEKTFANLPALYESESP
jgi:WD40 repeat protein